MADDHGYFDASAFFAAIDSERRGRGLNWKEVAAKSGVSASTLTRMGQGRRPDVDSLAKLAAWSGLDVDQFVRAPDDTRPRPQSLAMISTYLKTDPHLTDAGADALDALVKAAYERLRKREE